MARKKKQASIADTAASGDLQATLELMRSKLATMIISANTNVAAQVAGQLRAVLADLEQFEGTADENRTCLELIRSTLAKALDTVSVDDVAVAAQLSGQLRLTLSDLGALPASERSTVDDLANARAARRAKALDASAPPRPKRIVRP